MANPDIRRDTDFMKLMNKDYKVELINNETHNFNVHFNGPVNSFYQGGAWKVRVKLLEDYPCKSPSIRFLNKIYHPNIDEITGAVCLDVINSVWSPMFDLVNVFELLLPQLLTEPNTSDPYNDEASALMLKNMTTYEARVREYVLRYAKPEDTEQEKATDKEVSEDASVSGDEASASALGPIEPR